jgi:uncharacterized membrane protein YtjA (UPF0391 family)
MLQHAAACFVITIVASLIGFGGMVETATAAVKALAVVFLLLFFVSLFRLLFETEPSRSADL